jgi:GT2 family glycosyltransferase
VKPVVWLSGCAVLARCSALQTIGLLDPDFFIYSEDVDWCLRGREAGYDVLIVPQAKLWHKGVQRVYLPSPRITYLSVRNEFYLLVKHHAGPLALAATWLRHLRTLASWSLRPRWRERRPHRDALAHALRDFVLGRVGPPPLP